MTQSTWLILGASSALAKAFSHVVAEEGNDLILLGRDREDITITARDLSLRHNVSCEAICLDLVHQESLQKLKAICNNIDRVSIFFAFSVMLDEEYSGHETIRETFLTNTVATIQHINQFTAPKWLEKVSQMIVLSSVAGDRGRKKNCIYGASKAAVNTYIQGLRARTPELQVLLVKAGFIDTSMTYGREGVFFAASPSMCAKACLKAMKKNKKTLYYPRWWRYIMWAIKKIPEKIFIRLPI